MSNYFPHDCRTSRDYRIVKLEDELGLVGYAIYFKILEIMCEQNTYFLEKNYKVLSKLLNKNQTFLKKVVEKFELFDIDFEKNIFSSKFLQAHLEVKENTSNARKLAGLKGANNRWNKQNVDSNCHSVAILPLMAKNTNVLQKENTKKEKENENEKEKENFPQTPLKEKDKEKENIKRKRTAAVVDACMRTHACEGENAAEHNPKGEEKEKEKNCGKKEKNFEQEIFNAPLENEEQKSKNDWNEKQERFRKNFQKILDDADFAEVVCSSYPQFTITELQIIANEFRVRNEQSSKYNSIYWDKDYITELKNHFLNFLTKKVSLKIQKNQNDGNDKGFNPKNIGEEFITEYGDSMPEQVATYDLTTSREDVGASV